ncbi:MAG: hypothetical protein FJ276_06775 [Planctomycetes bacterium]|nr:hypothetical protein [Planctomycetota bacterium]
MDAPHHGWDGKGQLHPPGVAVRCRKLAAGHGQCGDLPLEVLPLRSREQHQADLHARPLAESLRNSIAVASVPFRGSEASSGG